MATKNIVPNADSEGGIGTSSKYWATGFIDAITTTGNLVIGGSIDLEGAIDVNGTTNLNIVDIDGAVNMATTALVTGVLTTTATQVANGGITSGSNIVSDTDSTDDLGTTSVRWANLFVDGITATDQITATGFTGTLDGILGSGTPAAATVTTLNTSGNITAAAAAVRVTVQDNADSASGGTLAIQNTDTGVNNHEGGRLYFYADDSSNNVIEAGLITSIFTNVSPTAKASSLRLSTYGSNGQVHSLTLAGTGIQVVDSGKIGCASDDDLLTLASGALTIAGKTLLTDGGNATTPSLQINTARNGLAVAVTNQLNLIANAVTVLTLGSDQKATFANKVILSSSAGTALDPNLLITNSGSGAYNHVIDMLAPNLTSGEQAVISLGKAGSTGNTGIIGFKYNGDNNNDSYIALGGWAKGDQFTFKNNGDQTIADGNLIIGTSGHGIDFSATGNSSVATPSEILDDYEEGTWTPTITKGSLIGGTIDVKLGKYIKVGNVLYITFYWYQASGNAGTTSGSSGWLLGGIPFSVLHGTYSFIPSGYGLISSTTTDIINARWQVNSTGTHAFLYGNGVNMDTVNNDGNAMEFSATGVLQCS